MAQPRQDLRQRVEQEVERLIALLDAVDGDENLEDNADGEPSIGGNVLNFEATDTELDGADDEPSLGAPETRLMPGGYHTAYAGAPMVDCCMPLGSQEAWADGLTNHDDEELNEDGDPAEQDGGGHVTGGGYHL